jgi:hypothetical protein
LIDKTNDLDENTERFDAGDPNRQKIDIAEARTRESCQSLSRRRRTEIGSD